MNRLLRLLLVLLLPAALASAVLPGAAPARADAAPPLAGTAWQLAAMDGELIPKGAGVGIAFGADGRVGGSGGCNRFGGGYTQDGGQITFTPLMSTRMHCPNGASDRERRFLAALEGTVRVDVDGDVLTLRPAGGGPVLSFLRAAAQESGGG